MVLPYTRGRMNQENSTEAEYARVNRALIACLNCATLFDPGNWKGPHGTKKFCSNKCRWSHKNQERLDARANLEAAYWQAMDAADALMILLEKINIKYHFSRSEDFAQEKRRAEGE